ncbi:GNAT family N-acetyltransferase [Conexibacter woesei]|uniref:GCN5-related N-acetyltransferase n=1 Tax=Conexibacter woesei (strain DSM 14684 / CCUG 47730 / CIP 108061 / JCM 11494 / NBRC 100937 / ID131577) TaxID=469383 RepID=D3FCP6_CONWI|nr:GNAT family N-acetyltransferase [Conexibacter woesei]ADB49519.1 GCN5-related N-acetyltransferase [Conexibacter woesei DSM 14684]
MSPTLHNGLAITVRPIRPDDKQRLARGHELMSPETQRLRYLMPKPRLTAAELRYLTEVDDRDHVALVAVADELPDATLGVGRFIRRRDRPDTAEFAIVIADEFQGLGLGSEIAEQLADAAVERGIRHFSATVLHENTAVRAVLARISRRLEYARWSDGSGELLYELKAA